MPDGIFCLDKPEGMTSFLCCAVLRRLMGEKKAGHAGTLDPMATGVLPILFGRATKAIPLLPSHDKRYTVTMVFGKTSDTQDQWGTVTPTGKPLPDREAVEGALKAFCGPILQTPPMVSALKKDGVRLYEWARRGVEVERQARPVTILALVVQDYDAQAGVLTFDCVCSAGTYMRTLCHDLGQRLGCGGLMTALRRTQAAGFCLGDSLTLDQARQLAEAGTLKEHLRPVETAFAAQPALTVSLRQAARFLNGGSLLLNRLNQTVGEGLIRVHAPDGRFLGLAAAKGDELAVVRVFAGPEPVPKEPQ